MSSRTVTRIAAALSVAAAGLAGATAHPAAALAKASVPRSPIVLGVIQYDSPGKDDRSQRSLNAEWVTVTNTGRGAVNLKAWTLTDRSRHTYTFRDLRLAAHQSVRVHTGIGRDSARDVYQGRRDYVWNNAGDTATLRDNHSHVVAAKSWGRR
ncbi:lamin tail domain-containing protein [Streptomyces sp. ASQP_92]|uniref:lamin tail domain-containing protein n=1 Tax=Streptomyces sp. ASQP_92 TaxID=2979116 RepID=UPI0021C2502C|nr:lamin tail domain-containing protein [Streptomyces sp. ASQP_92]MCT9089819.1 lamin tail domain-containing protein [Streptomyces sp. ASQP_92]